MRISVSWMTLIFGVWAVAVTPLHSQTHMATVRGATEDASGARVPGVEVALTNIDQNRTWRVVTNETGEYVFVQIPPGRYTLSAQLPGFKTYERSGLTLEVAQAVEINVRLELGEVTESVEVRAAAPLLNATNAALGQVVENAFVRSIPLIDRSVMRLVYLTAGLVPSNVDPGASNQGFATNFVSNGVRKISTEVYMDGAPVTALGDGEGGTFLGLKPNVESVQEFKVQTNFLSAEFGYTGGSVVNMVSKSGTNRFHGSAWEYFRNHRFNANSFFRQARRQRVVARIQSAQVRLRLGRAALDSEAAQGDGPDVLLLESGHRSVEKSNG